MKSRLYPQGFTIVELLIVIVIIGVLASITVVAFNGIQDRARLTDMKTDIATLQKAIMAARESRQMSLIAMTGNNGYGAGGESAACNRLASGTNLATLAQTDDCWVFYNRILTEVTNASGINVKGIVDPWNRPYSIVEECGPDQIWAFSNPYASWGGRIAGTQVNLPRDSYATC